MSDVRLAWNWTKTRVLECLNKAQKGELIRFLAERHKERFFIPIHHLKTAEGNEHGFGFAIMSLCCLLVETIECYRQGLPSSYSGDLDECESSPANSSAPPEYRLQGPFKNIRSSKIFEDFFARTQHRAFSPSVDAKEFYGRIRCGLLHQAQTANGWCIVRTGKFWDGTQKTINRDEIAERLEACFDSYLEELSATNWTDDVWKMARKKIWWLAEVS